MSKEMRNAVEFLPYMLMTFVSRKPAEDVKINQKVLVHRFLTERHKCGKFYIGS